MTTARSVIITLALALLLWPLVAHAAPAPVSGTLTINPPLQVTGSSQARFYLARAGVPGGDFGRFVGSQQVVGQTFDYSFTIPDGSFSSGVSYWLTVYVTNGTGSSRAGWTLVYPSGGAELDFTAGSYSGSLPPGSSGSAILLIGLILAAVAMILLLWRQLHLQSLARRVGAA